jgi:hypothetical protein
MSKSLFLKIIIFCISFLLVSCATAPPQKHIPGPTEIKIKSSLGLSLPDDTAAQLKIPPKLNGDLSIKVNAEALEDEPLRSHFLGSISIVFSNTVTKQNYLNFETTVEGNTDGSPNEGVTEAFKKFFDAIMLLHRSTNQFIPKNQNESAN